MKCFLILSLCNVLLFAGCNRKAAQKEGEPQAESASKGNLVEVFPRSSTSGWSSPLPQLRS